MHHFLVDADQLGCENITYLAGLYLNFHGKQNKKQNHCKITFFLNDTQKPRIATLKKFRNLGINHVVVPAFKQSADMALIAHLQEVITISKLKKTTCSLSVLSNDTCLKRMSKIIAGSNLIPITTTSTSSKKSQLRNHLKKAG